MHPDHLPKTKGRSRNPSLGPQKHLKVTAAIRLDKFVSLTVSIAPRGRTLFWSLRLRAIEAQVVIVRMQGAAKAGNLDLNSLHLLLLLLLLSLLLPQVITRIDEPMVSSLVGCGLTPL